MGNGQARYAEGGGDPRWGENRPNVLFDSLFHLAAGYRPARKRYYRTLFHSIPMCEHCDNFSLVCADRPVDAYLKSPKKLLEWVYLTNVAVRKRQGIPVTYTLAQVQAYYLQPWPPAKWGPQTWEMLYRLAASYTPQRRRYYQQLFRNLGWCLRCDTCNTHLREICTDRPIDEYLESPERLLLWVYLTHTDAKKKQGKSMTFTFNDVLRRHLRK